MVKTRLRNLLTLVATVLLCFGNTAVADLVLAEGEATGSWFNPERSGEGFFVEIPEINGSNMFTVAMYSFDASGDPLWLTGNVAIGPEDQSAVVTLYQYDGPVWGPDYDPNDLNTTVFGTMSVTFPTCNSAFFQISSQTALPGGSYSLVRLTQMEGIECTDPPPPQQGYTPGRWLGTGVCFNVGEDGQTITEVGSSCELGNAFDSDLENGKMNGLGGDCDVEAKCEGVWQIRANTFQCVSGKGTLTIGVFDSFTSASGTAFEGEAGEADYCVANWSATPE